MTVWRLGKGDPEPSDPPLKVIFSPSNSSRFQRIKKRTCNPDTKAIRSAQITFYFPYWILPGTWVHLEFQHSKRFDFFFCSMNFQSLIAIVLSILLTVTLTHHRPRGVENKATQLTNERKRLVIIVVWSEKGFSIKHGKTFRFLPENKSKKAKNTIESRVFVFLNIAFVLVVDSAERDCGTKPKHIILFVSSVLIRVSTIWSSSKFA